MTLFERGKAPRSIPVFGTDEVADVTGAGDTVAAAIALAMAAGLPLGTGARLANVAAGLAVMKLGTATVSSEEVDLVLRRGR